MSYEEIVNGATAERREARCRRDRMICTAMQCGGWLLAGLLMVIQFATIAH